MLLLIYLILWLVHGFAGLEVDYLHICFFYIQFWNCNMYTVKVIYDLQCCMLPFPQTNKGWYTGTEIFTCGSDRFLLMKLSLERHKLESFLEIANQRNPRFSQSLSPQSTNWDCSTYGLEFLRESSNNLAKKQMKFKLFLLYRVYIPWD